MCKKITIMFVCFFIGCVLSSACWLAGILIIRGKYNQVIANYRSAEKRSIDIEKQLDETIKRAGEYNSVIDRLRKDCSEFERSNNELREANKRLGSISGSISGIITGSSQSINSIETGFTEIETIIRSAKKTSSD